jgi:heptaprenyl diphosphate synthase/octaprenyl-diphosphate synthase
MPSYDTQPTNSSETHPAVLPPADAAASQIPRDIKTILTHANLQDDMEAVERLLLKRSASQSPQIADAGAYLIRAGGKRMRAAQALLAARLGAYDFDQARHAAATVEFIHTASLVHDDLVDHTQQRRGRVTVHARWDTDVALMVGDYFFALAAAEMALCRDPRIVLFYAQAVQTIVSGELHPVTDVAPLDVAMSQYTRKVGAKTAALFEAGCKAGIASAGGSDAAVAALGSYGYDLGIAFQIVDDVLDFVGDERTLGKPPGNDLREGTITLPLIYAVAETDDAFLRKLAGVALTDPVQVKQAVDAVVLAGGVERAQAASHAYVSQAIAHLDGFSPSPARHALIELARFVVQRQM